MELARSDMVGKSGLRSFVWSFATALVLTVLLGVIASAPRWSAVGTLLAPGLLIAAVVFPEGTHSSWAYTYLVLAGLVNAFILAWPVLWLWTMIERRRAGR